MTPKVVQSALDCAVVCHRDKYLPSGLPYISHTLDVLKKISVWGIKEYDVWCLALLQETDIDCEEEFGQEMISWIKDQDIKKPQVFLVKVADAVCSIKDKRAYQDKKELWTVMAVAEQAIVEWFGFNVWREVAVDVAMLEMLYE